MDTTALSLCMDNQLPIVVFDVNAEDGIYHALRGDAVGTIISAEPGADPIRVL
jgi:uridylate kinase